MHPQSAPRHVSVSDCRAVLPELLEALRENPSREVLITRRESAAAVLTSVPFHAAAAAALGQAAPILGDGPLLDRLQEFAGIITETAAAPSPDLEVMTYRAGLGGGATLALLGVVQVAFGFHRNDSGRCASCRDTDGYRVPWPCTQYLHITRALSITPPSPEGPRRA